MPNLSARQPAGWDEEEDGPWDAGYVDGEDGAGTTGGFFRQLSLTLTLALALALALP